MSGSRIAKPIAGGKKYKRNVLTAQLIYRNFNPDLPFAIFTFEFVEQLAVQPKKGYPEVAALMYELPPSGPVDFDSCMLGVNTLITKNREYQLRVASGMGSLKDTIGFARIAEGISDATDAGESKEEAGSGALSTPAVSAQLSLPDTVAELYTKEVDDPAFSASGDKMYHEGLTSLSTILNTIRSDLYDYINKYCHTVTALRGNKDLTRSDNQLIGEANIDNPVVVSHRIMLCGWIYSQLVAILSANVSSGTKLQGLNSVIDVCKAITRESSLIRPGEAFLGMIARLFQNKLRPATTEDITSGTYMMLRKIQKSIKELILKIGPSRTQDSVIYRNNLEDASISVLRSSNDNLCRLLHLTLPSDFSTKLEKAATACCFHAPLTRVPLEIQFKYFLTSSTAAQLRKLVLTEERMTALLGLFESEEDDDSAVAKFCKGREYTQELQSFNELKQISWVGILMDIKRYNELKEALSHRATSAPEQSEVDQLEASLLKIRLPSEAMKEMSFETARLFQYVDREGIRYRVRPGATPRSEWKPCLVFKYSAEKTEEECRVEFEILLKQFLALRNIILAVTCGQMSLREATGIFGASISRMMTALQEDASLNLMQNLQSMLQLQWSKIEQACDGILDETEGRNRRVSSDYKPHLQRFLNLFIIRSSEASSGDLIQQSKKVQSNAQELLKTGSVKNVSYQLARGVTAMTDASTMNRLFINPDLPPPSLEWISTPLKGLQQAARGDRVMDSSAALAKATTVQRSIADFKEQREQNRFNKMMHRELTQGARPSLLDKSAVIVASNQYYLALTQSCGMPVAHAKQCILPTATLLRVYKANRLLTEGPESDDTALEVRHSSTRGSNGHAGATASSSSGARRVDAVSPPVVPKPKAKTSTAFGMMPGDMSDMSGAGAGGLYSSSEEDSDDDLKSVARRNLGGSRRS